MRNVLLMILLLGASLDAFAANRLGNMPRIRCDEGNKSVCSETNDQWSKLNCINAEERAWLSATNLMVSCKYNGGWIPTGVCPCGCFHPSVVLLGTQKDTGIAGEFSVFDIAQYMNNYSLASFSKDSSLNSLISQEEDIAMGTVGPEKEALVNLFLGNGRVLKLTTKHRVVLADGSIVKAIQLRAGSLLLASTGQEVVIESIERETYAGQVYNFATSAPLVDLSSHLIIAEGVIVGDVVYQNQLANQEIALAVRQ